MVHMYSNNHHMTRLLCPCAGTVGRTAGGEGGERQGRGRGEIPQTDHHSIGTGQSGLEGEKGGGREGGGERGKRGGGWEKRRGTTRGHISLVASTPLSWCVQDLGVKVQAVVEETEVLKQSLQRLQQSSASREEVSKLLVGPFCHVHLFISFPSAYVAWE